MTGRRWRVEFSAAASTFDWSTLNRLSREYVKALYAAPAPHGSVDAILQMLRENLRYEELEEVADAALAFGLGSAAVRRQYAQALVDGGNPAVALTLYESVVADNGTLDRDRIDARGGIGRCYKELFIACTDPDRRQDYLLRAFDAYHDVYVGDPGSTYHGINAAALLARAEREGIELPPGTPRSTSVAEAVLEVLDTDPVPDNMWNAVTAAEACVALGRHDDAVERAEAFLHGGPRGFTVASFLRQLQAVWQLDTSSPPGDQLLPVLRSALLTYKGGQVTVGSGDVRAGRLDAMAEDGHLELVLGYDRYQSYRWYVNGLNRCRAVARIQTCNDDGVGTGFLASGTDLHPDLPPLVVITNGHVVPEGLDIDDGVVAFHGLEADPGQKVALQIARTCWYEPSTPPGLDTTILELKEYPAGVTPVPLAAKLPRLTGKAPPRAFVIGHPRGLATPQFSLQDNVLLDHDDRYLHYRSPTEPGSSGSPVFNSQWELIGVHHAGGFDLPRLNDRGGTHAANEGITLPAIRTRLSERPPGRRS